jgi:hypothetical protein
VLPIYLHRATARDSRSLCATDTTRGQHFAPAWSRGWWAAGERLAGRLGFAGSRATILRHLVRHQSLPDSSAPRVVGLDEWASRKGFHYGTIAVDLERRTVIDVLPDRSAVSTAGWLAERTSIELIARDRDGLYADASRQGAPQAKQIADRFHLVQNLRSAIERQLSGLEGPIRGYRANPGRRLPADNMQPDGKVGADEARELTHVSGRSCWQLSPRSGPCMTQVKPLQRSLASFV